MVGQEKR
jgi:hypothetical protein